MHQMYQTSRFNDNSENSCDELRLIPAILSDLISPVLRQADRRLLSRRDAGMLLRRLAPACRVEVLFTCSKRLKIPGWYKQWGLRASED